VEHLKNVVAAARKGLYEHHLATYSAAIAFQALVALVPLTLLGFALLGAFGLEDVWTSSLAPAIEPHLTRPVFDAIDYTVRRIFSDDSTGLIVFATALLVWQLSRVVGAIGVALNAIHESRERRPLANRVAVDVGLGVAIGVTLVGSVLIVAVVPRLVGGGVGELLVKLAAILVAAVLLAVPIGLLIRYAPAEHAPPAWASAGSILVVVSWIVASLAYGWWAGSVANYKTASGNLLVFLVLTAYVQVCSAIFLVGVELDELAQEEAKGGKRRASQRRRRLIPSRSRG
jgi:membrane protein